MYKKKSLVVQRKSPSTFNVHPSIFLKWIHPFIHSLIPIDPNVCWHENLPHVINEKWYFFPLFISLYKKKMMAIFFHPPYYKTVTIMPLKKIANQKMIDHHWKNTHVTIIIIIISLCQIHFFSPFLSYIQMKFNHHYHHHHV